MNNRLFCIWIGFEQKGVGLGVATHDKHITVRRKTAALRDFNPLYVR
jgi:hypothetical protein